MKFIFLLLLSLSTNSFAVQIGTASYYGPGFHGKRAADGSTFNMHKLTAAHKTIKFGKRVKVTNLHNKKSVIVTITDRGPYSGKRIIDLSTAAKTAIDMGGLARVSIQVLD